MSRIAIIDRADMNAEQARVYDAAKQTSGVVSGPYYAYIRLPKVFEASQALRAAVASGPLSRREHQLVNLAVARHWNARYPWYAQVRNSLSIGIEQPVIDAINARKPPSLTDAREGLESLVTLIAAVGAFSMTCITAATFQIDPPADDPAPLAG
jgi:hypothetical protein